MSQFFRLQQEIEVLCRKNATLAVKVERLQAIIDKLPKCWRLDESGKLVRDVPVVPNMRIWRHEWPTALGEKVLEVDGQDRMRLDGQSYMYCGKDVSNTYEAAEAARAG